MGNEVFVAYDRRACEGLEDLPRTAPVTGCGPVWIPEAASCLTSKAPVNRKVDRWLVDTGCGYDLVSREHTAATRRWVRKGCSPADIPNGKWSHHDRQGRADDGE